MRAEDVLGTTESSPLLSKDVVGLSLWCSLYGTVSKGFGTLARSLTVMAAPVA